jgi:hypothetical protein
VQFGIRTGLSFPIGRATGAAGDDLHARYSLQVPFVFDLGAKLSRAVYLGGYLGFGIGTNGTNDRVEQLCDDRDSNTRNDVECSAYSVRLGIEARYYLSPDESVDPWLSYGIGFEAAAEAINDHPRGRSEQTTVTGIEFARLGVGFDWRASRVFGLGPLLELALGRYGGTRTEVNGAQAFDGSIGDAAVHGWVTLGLRGVFFP